LPFTFSPQREYVPSRPTYTTVHSEIDTFPASAPSDTVMMTFDLLIAPVWMCDDSWVQRYSQV